MASVLAHCWVCVDRAHPHRLLPSPHHLPSARSIYSSTDINLFGRVTSARLSQLMEAKKAYDVEEALQRTERHRVFWEAKALEKLTAEQLQSAAIDAAEADEDRAAEAKLEGAAEKDEEPLTMAQVEPKLVAQGSEYRNADARLYPSRHTASQNVPFPFSFRPPPPLHYN